MSEQDTSKRKRGQRGPGKKPAMVHISLRIPAETLAFYKRGEASNTMREVLVEYAKNNLDIV